jgi:hypothetical protein
LSATAEIVTVVSPHFSFGADAVTVISLSTCVTLTGVVLVHPLASLTVMV